MWLFFYLRYLCATLKRTIAFATPVAIRLVLFLPALAVSIFSRLRSTRSCAVLGNYRCILYVVGAILFLIVVSETHTNSASSPVIPLLQLRSPSLLGQPVRVSGGLQSPGCPSLQQSPLSER